jgi:hypothetical protein
MATDLATLAIKVENGDVVKTTTSLNSMEVAGTKAEASTTRLTRRMALLEIQARQMDTALAKSQSTTGKLVSAMGLTEEAAAKLGHAFGALSAVAAVGFLGHKLVEETIAAQNAMAQLEAAVLATGGSAGRTVAQMDELSLALQKQTTFSDEAVKGAEAILLTFNKIKGDNLDRATVAVTNLATRLGKDLPEAALQVGKALQDPVEGLNALTRLGIRLSQSQKDAIQDLVDTGHAAQAQGIILTELEHRYAGAAEAARNTLGGALKGLANDFGDLFEVSRGGTSGVVDAIHGLDSAVRTVGENMGTVVRVGELVAAVFAGKMVAGLTKAAAAQIEVASAAAGAATVQREAAASAVATATAQEASAARVVTALQAEAVEIERLIVLEQQRAAAARAAAASVSFQITPTNTGATGPAADYYGRKAQEEQNRAATAARTAALAEETAALASAEALEQRRAGVMAQATAVEVAATEATVARTLAVAREGEVIAATSLAAQAGAAATGFFGKAIAALGGPISATIIAAVAINAALDAYEEHMLKAAEQTDAQREATELALATAHARAAAQKKEADELSESAKKFAALSEERQNELGKIQALNAAYRASALAQQVIGVQYDANIERAKNAAEHNGRELTKLNQLTSAVAAETVQRALLNDQLAREEQLRQFQTANREAVRSAQHSVTLAGLDPQDRDTRQVELSRIDAIADADRKYKEEERHNLIDLQVLQARGDAQAVAAVDARRAQSKREHDETVARYNLEASLRDEAIKRERETETRISVGITVADTEAQTRGIRAMMAAELEGTKATEQMSIYLAGQDTVRRAVNDATARGTQLTDEQSEALRRSAEELERTRIEAAKLQAVYREVSSAANQFFTDVFNRKNPGPALAQRIKEDLIAALTDVAARPITIRIAKILGIELPESKQEKAAKVMNEAADKMLRAAGLMNGSPDGTVADAGTVFNPVKSAAQQKWERAIGIAGAGAIGYGTGYGVGQITGSGTLGAIGGAAAGAAAGAKFGVPGAVIGGLAGFVGGIVGAGDAAREAAARLEAARRSFTNSWNAIVAEINGDELAKAIAGADDRFQQLAQQYADTLTVTDLLHGKLASGLADINAKEAEYIANLKLEAANKARSQIESYRERELRAEGRNAEADALHAQEERQELIDSFGKEIDATERSILAAYDAAAAAEKNTAAINSLTTKITGAPSGFKIEGYIQQYAKASPYPGQWQLPTNPFVPPTLPLAPPGLTQTGMVATRPPTFTIASGAIVVQGAKDPKTTAALVGKEIGTKLAAFLDELNGSKPLGTPRASALDLITRPSGGVS